MQNTTGVPFINPFINIGQNVPTIITNGTENSTPLFAQICTQQYNPTLQRLLQESPRNSNQKETEVFKDKVYQTDFSSINKYLNTAEQYLENNQFLFASLSYKNALNSEVARMLTKDKKLEIYTKLFHCQMKVWEEEEDNATFKVERLKTWIETLESCIKLSETNEEKFKYMGMVITSVSNFLSNIDSVKFNQDFQISKILIEQFFKNFDIVGNEIFSNYVNYLLFKMSFCINGQATIDKSISIEISFVFVEILNHFLISQKLKDYYSAWLKNNHKMSLPGNMGLLNSNF